MQLLKRWHSINVNGMIRGLIRIFMPGKSHGLRSLVGYNPWGRKESDTTERLLCVCVYVYMELESEKWCMVYMKNDIMIYGFMTITYMYDL